MSNLLTTGVTNVQFMQGWARPVIGCVLKVFKFALVLWGLPVQTVASETQSQDRLDLSDLWSPRSMARYGKHEAMNS